ncbi:ABC transporter substrate-binding protein, partial [Acidisphaera sp. L21]|uniref:ABC transporter substrate-binding protein n=1 Tax=Acidisphaera sp. L21 TaxID=1641851 RepID=UPI00131CA27A
MKRRVFLGAAGAILAAPHISAAQKQKIVRFVPNADLAITDPIVTTSLTTRLHAYLVFDTLFGLDNQYHAQPQMLDGYLAEDGGRRWTLKLRAGLRFHDDTPVLARDAVASLRRWARRDSYGLTLWDAVDDVSAPDDRTILFRMKRPFAALAEALGKTGPNMAAIMPERLANADPFIPLKEVVGSGPFRFVPGERVPGSLVVYERFAGYVPRSSGEIGFSSGPKVPKLDRVEWRIIPDATTAANALDRGEVDWVETPTPDLMQVLARNHDIVIQVADQVGIIPLLRFNCLQPPFDRAEVRRVVLHAVCQADVLAAYTSDPSLIRGDVGIFPQGTPMANRAGMDGLFGPTDLAKVKAELKASGYAGQPVALMGASDNPVTASSSLVIGDLLQRIGFNVDFQTVDNATLVQRRSSKQPVDKGGWSLFIVGYAAADMSPAESFPIRGNGAGAWFGWPTSPGLEALRTDWIDAPDDAAKRATEQRIQLQAWQDV